MGPSRVDIETRDGRCPAFVFRPAGSGPFPPVILYMDAPGVRSGLFEMAARLASEGYFTLLPDLAYRVGGSDEESAKRVFTDAAFRREWATKVLGSATLTNVASDTEAFLAFLAAQPDVRQPFVGVTGYCMGGGHALTAAGLHPERIVAAASYHGGHLATDAPESPHRLAPRIEARVYVAAADEDPIFPPAMAERLRDALTEAKVDFVLETYEGERHGFAPPDTPVHTARAGERHWASLLTLLDETLRVPRSAPPHRTVGS